MALTVTLNITGDTLGDIEYALEEAGRMIGEGYTSLGHPFKNETGSFDFTVEGTEEGDEDEDSDSGSDSDSDSDSGSDDSPTSPGGIPMKDFIVVAPGGGSGGPLPGFLRGHEGDDGGAGVGAPVQPKPAPGSGSESVDLPDE